MKTAIALSTTLIAFTASGALASELAATSANHEALFEQFDTNSDSVVTTEEASASMMLSDQFETLDEDGSGDLTLAEFEQLELNSGLQGGMEGQGDS